MALPVHVLFPWQRQRSRASAYGRNSQMSQNRIMRLDLHPRDGIPDIAGTCQCRGIVEGNGPSGNPARTVAHAGR